MRDSRIPHPPGGRFLLVHDWAVQTLGRAGAAVLAVIDFLDRREETPGVWVASRARVVADLEGFVGRNAVDAALDDLVSRGWLRRKNHVELGPTNLIHRVQFALDADAIAKFLASSRTKVEPDVPESGSPTSRNREIGEPEMGAEIGTGKGSSYKNKEKDKTTTTSRVHGHRLVQHKAVAPSGAGGGGIDSNFLNELVDAAIAIARNIENEPVYRASIRKRILAQNGPNADDLATLTEFRRRRDAAIEQAARVEEARRRDELAMTPEARERGKRELAALREKLGVRP